MFGEKEMKVLFLTLAGEKENIKDMVYFLKKNYITVPIKVSGTKSKHEKKCPVYLKIILYPKEA